MDLPDPFVPATPPAASFRPASPLAATCSSPSPHAVPRSTRRPDVGLKPLPPDPCASNQLLIGWEPVVVDLEALGGDVELYSDPKAPSARPGLRGKPLAVIVNGNGYDLNDYEDLASYLARRGFYVAVAHRPVGVDPTDFTLETIDVALDEIGQSAAATPVGLVGHSVGGGHRDQRRGAQRGGRTRLRHPGRRRPGAAGKPRRHAPRRRARTGVPLDLRFAGPRRRRAVRRGQRRLRRLRPRRHGVEHDLPRCRLLLVHTQASTAR